MERQMRAALFSQHRSKLRKEERKGRKGDSKEKEERKHLGLKGPFCTGALYTQSRAAAPALARAGSWA